MGIWALLFQALGHNTLLCCALLKGLKISGGRRAGVRVEALALAQYQLNVSLFGSKRQNIL